MEQSELSWNTQWCMNLGLGWGESFIKDIFSRVKGRTEVGRRAEGATLVKMTYGDLCCPAQTRNAKTAQSWDWDRRGSVDTTDNNGGGRIYQSIALHRAVLSDGWWWGCHSSGWYPDIWSWLRLEGELILKSNKESEMIQHFPSLKIQRSVPI